MAGGVSAGYFFWPQTPVNLLIVTLDTTRADRLGCYGYSQAATPALDALAADGVLFENAYAPCPVTLPSHCTMFTGLTPREHGIHHNGLGALDGKIPTLAGGLSRLGYATGGFVGAFVLHRKFGLDRGFRTYDDSVGAEILNGQVQRRRNGSRVVDAALEWLRPRVRQPFCCWVHLFDPHAPYQAREELFGDRFAAQPYDAGISFVDRQVGRLVEFLDEHDLRRRTLIVIVGDHGEGLGEHGEREHGHMLYNSTIRVPLLIVDPSSGTTGRRVSTAVSLVDLEPTIADCLGLKLSPNAAARSFGRAMRGETMPARACYIESDIPFLEHRWAPQRAFVAENWKYIRSPRPELYNLVDDPAELHNLAETLPDRVESLEASMLNLEMQIPARGAEQVKLSANDRRSLASLGYVGDPAGDRRDGQNPTEIGQALPDIKDRLRYHEAVEDANMLLDQNQPQAALQALEKIVAAVPDYLPARMFLGEALVKTGNLHEARAVFEQVVGDDPELAAARSRLGWVLGHLNEPETALAELKRAFDLAPDTAEFHVNLGSTYFELSHPDEATEMFRRAVEIDSAAANFEIGRILAAGGDVKGAIRSYKQTLADDPNWIHLHSEIAILLARQKHFDEAIDYARKAVELCPRDADAHYNLGVMYAEKALWHDAVSALQTALRLNPRHPKAAARLHQIEQRSAKP
jgi:arylsulfatase A-like enzyme/Flp pilus assembly protein TadD